MKMYVRCSFVLVLILSAFSPGYAQQASLSIWETEIFSPQKRRIGVGITFRRDQYVYQKYFWKADLVIGTYRRNAQWSLSTQWPLLAKSELLWLTLEGSYQQDRVVFDENDMKGLLVNYNGPDYEEKLTYRRYRISPGIQIEPLANFGLSPFVNAKALLVFPTQLHYDYEVTSTNIPSNVIRQSVENGAKLSMGWEFEVGLRAQVNPKVVVYGGFYYQELEQKVDWPKIESREIRDTILGFNHRGFIARIHYIW